MTRAACRYYTVGLNDIADMETSYCFGLTWTPHTKIKGVHSFRATSFRATSFRATLHHVPSPHNTSTVDDDIARLQRILAALLPLKPTATTAMCPASTSIPIF